MDKSDPAYGDAWSAYGETVRDLRLKARDLLRGCYALRGFQTPQSEEALETAKQLCRLLNQRTVASPGSASAVETRAQASSECGKNVCEPSSKSSQTPPGSAPTIVADFSPYSDLMTQVLPSRWTHLVPINSDISSPLLMVGVATLSGIAIAAIRRRRHFSRSSQVTGSGGVGGGGARQMPELDSS